MRGHRRAPIPARMCRGTDAAQPSFGMVATVVVSDDMPKDTAYAITKAVFENFEDFKKLHPAEANITKEGALRGATVPFHPGAVKYFKDGVDVVQPHQVAIPVCNRLQSNEYRQGILRCAIGVEATATSE